MAFIETTPVNDATGDVRAMYERQQQSWGFVPNYAKVFCHRPEIMSLWASMLRGIRSHVDPRRFELVTLAAAHALRSSYCSLAHGKALTEHFSAEEIQAMLGESDVPVESLTNAEVMMMAFARKVVTGASRITAGEVATLKSYGFTDAEIFDIASVAAARAFFAQLVESLGAEADASFLEIDDELRHTLAVGRPISFKAVERVEAETVTLSFGRR
ncbi:MAG: carboxymuconolactone decarboxylase family protein [Gammaproteobacteria bacterium]